MLTVFEFVGLNDKNAFYKLVNTCNYKTLESYSFNGEYFAPESMNYEVDHFDVDFKDNAQYYTIYVYC